MRFRILPTIVVLALFSCEHNDINSPQDIPPGSYEGQFSRSTFEIDYAPANVTLTFTGTRFSGESDRAKYPAICNGTYTIAGQEIEFVNECAWTADFDWSYILSGKFKLSVKGNKVEMTKQSGTTIDHYTLMLK